MSKGPANFIGTHHYNWRQENNERVDPKSTDGRRERNLSVYRDLERRKTEQHIQNLIKAGYRPPLTPAQRKAGARRVI